MQIAARCRSTRVQKIHRSEGQTSEREVHDSRWRMGRGWKEVLTDGGQQRSKTKIHFQCRSLYEGIRF